MQTTNDCQMESMSEQSQRFIAVFQIMQKTNRFVLKYNKQTGLSSRQKTCIRCILIHLNSEFQAMPSSTCVKSTTPCDGNNIFLPLSFLLFFLHAYRKI